MKLSWKIYYRALSKLCRASALYLTDPIKEMPVSIFFDGVHNVVSEWLSKTFFEGNCTKFLKTSTSRSVEKLFLCIKKRKRVSFQPGSNQWISNFTFEHLPPIAAAANPTTSKKTRIFFIFTISLSLRCLKPAAMKHYKIETCSISIVVRFSYRVRTSCGSKPYLLGSTSFVITFQW